MSNNIIVKKDFSLPKAPGVYYRLMCLTGPDKGISYYTQGNRIVAGRSENADIVIKDTKASREHFEIVVFNDECVLSDLGSHNGVIINDLRVKQHTLKDGDKIIVGQTVYKFTIHSIAKVEVAPKEGSLDSGENESEENTPDVPKKKPKLWMVLVLGIGLFFLLDESPPPIKKETESLSRVNIPSIKTGNAETDQDIEQKFIASIHRGLREMREKNFFRAIDDFNMALLLKPNDGRASFYLNKAKKELDDEIESYFLVARRDYESVRYDSSLQNYCTIMRILERYKDDMRYKDALSNADHIIKFLGYEDTGEDYCFKR